MAFDFPASPTNGQEYTSGGATYVYNGWGWSAKSSPWMNYVSKVGDTMTGNLEVSKSQPQFILTKTTDNLAALLTGRKGALNRWTIALGDSVAESTGDVGSDFRINAFDDAGNMKSINPVFLLSRATGSVTIAGGFYLSGGVTGTLATDGFRAGYAGGYTQVKLNGANGSIIDFSTSGVDYKARLIYGVSTDTLQIVAAKTEVTNGLTTRNVVVTGAPNAQWGLDLVNYGSVTLAASATYDIPFGSGLISVYADGGQAAGLIMCIFGGINFIVNYSSTMTAVKDTANKLNFYYNSGTATYRFQNSFTSSIVLFIATIKLRPSS